MGKTSNELTSKQIECLYLVNQQMTSKEIARVLGVSRHTVDQRLDIARRKLGAQTRREAARKFALMQKQGVYQAAVYETSGIDDLGDSATFEASALTDQKFRETEAGSRSPTLSDDGVGHHPSTRVLPPFGGGKHSLSKTRISVSILTIAFLSMVCLSGLVLLVLGIMEILK